MRAIAYLKTFIRKYKGVNSTERARKLTNTDIISGDNVSSFRQFRRKPLDLRFKPLEKEDHCKEAQSHPCRQCSALMVSCELAGS